MTAYYLLAVLIILAGGAQGKVYERCDFARELHNVHGLARATLGNWVCLAQVRIVQQHNIQAICMQYESSYNTAATNDNTNGSRDYGIFQVIN